MNDQQQPAGGKPGDEPSEEHDRQRSEEPRNAYDDPVDDASADSFPASDPPSFTDSTATRRPDDR
ncbi:MAG: hypothetical protein M3N29_01790 [Chloroflexota bacterium]|nr:hypothetical protein [Chloroflexota bacterium]